MLSGKLRDYFEYLLVFNLLIWLVIVLEVVTYPKFLQHRFGISSDSLIIIGSFLTFLTLIKHYLLSKKFHNRLLINIYRKLVMFSFIISLPANLFLGFIETRNYPNYIFSKVHIIIENIPTLVTYSLINLILVLGINERSARFIKEIIKPSPITKQIKRFNRDSLYWAAIVLALIVYAIGNINHVYPWMISTTISMIGNSGLSYEEKMRKNVGFFYDYINFVKSVTPENAIIAIPPMEHPWESEGNLVYTWAFLYPRKLVQGTKVGLPQVNYDYILIAKGSTLKAGESDYGWPRERVKADKIWYLDETTLSFNNSDNTIFDPTFSQNKDVWGLIKVAK